MNLKLIPEEIRISGHYPTGLVLINGKILYPQRSLKVRNHSPDGFNWGYNGSGPAQLSLAILMRYMSDDLATILYQTFKFNVIGRLPQTDLKHTIKLRQEVESILREKGLNYETIVQ